MIVGKVFVGPACPHFLCVALTRLLFGIRPTGPATFVSVAVLLLVVAMLATYLPARWAALTSPVRAFRQE